MDPNFSENDIKNAMWTAIKKLHDNEEQLILNECSERAQVHHLAIYFDEAIKKCFNEKYQDPKPFPYKVDVEYNRVGDDGISKMLYGYCLDGEKNSEKECCKDCDKKKNERIVTIDMVFHVRGKGDLENNVFCLEVKPQQHPSSTCDRQRIKTLVLGNGSENPRYCYGLALHILKGTNGKLAEGDFYSIYKSEPEEWVFDFDKCRAKKTSCSREAARQ